jgi:hypothetical protein
MPLKSLAMAIAAEISKLAAVADPRQMTTFHYFSAEMNQETAHEC